MKKPTTNLFMLMSVDGKISTGSADILDVDKDFPKIDGVKEGLYQYYNLEQTTDLYSLNSGRVMAKVGANNPSDNLRKLPVSFLIIDNRPHLNHIGIDNFIKKSKKIFIITTNRKHPAFDRKDVENLEIIYYKNKIDFVDLFNKLKCDYKISDLTIQTGGTLNSIFLRKNLIDNISIVIAPALIGGSNTPSLIDGFSLTKTDELFNIKALELTNLEKLNNSYIYVQYKVIKNKTNEK